MSTTTSPRVDQMLTAVREARAFAPYNRTLTWPEGDRYTHDCALASACGYEGMADSLSAAEASGLDLAVFVRPGEGAVLVRGDFWETYRADYSGPEEVDWPTPLDALGLATFLGEQECRRCWTLDGPGPLVRHVLHVACGRTVVEMAYCDACMMQLEEGHDLVWVHGGPDAAV